MRRAVSLAFFFASLLSVFISSLASQLVPIDDEDAESSTKFQNDGPGRQAKIDTLHYHQYCASREIPSIPKCIHYEYQSAERIEAFIVDGDVFEQRKVRDDDIFDPDVILPGSYCMGRKCELTADLHGVKNWCLIFLNIDPDLATANVHYKYQVCVEEEEGHEDLILILSITCVGLVVVAFFSCLACCWMLRHRRKNSGEDSEKKSELHHSMAFPLIPAHPMPSGNDLTFIPPPPPHPPPIVSVPYRHEPAFQVQPPLPISHVPPTPSPTAQPSTSHREIHVRFPKSERQTKSRSRTNLRFPI